MTSHIEEPGPNELRDPFVRQELKRAGVWIGLVVLVALIWLLAQPLLLIVGGVVFAAMLDGGTRLLGRVLPISRVWRLLIVSCAGL
jgi:predicted PurR-regulated permease PerM